MNEEKRETKVLKTDAEGNDAEPIREAASVLRSGGLVAFPTETVYGLGANALSAEAVAKIFVAKGRPASNPLIVHVASIEGAKELTSDWTPLAQRLAEAFWPGPLTLVLPKSERVPDIVTGGGSTVAIRIPAHSVALRLLRETGLPIAAPSANRSLSLSPTSAEHVLKSLRGRIDLILDGGSCRGGIESTVLNLTVDPPRILRPGLISANEIEAVIGLLASADPQHDAGISDSHRASSAHLSPGMMEKHYAPETPLAWGYEASANGLADQGEVVAYIARNPLTESSEFFNPNCFLYAMPETPREYAAALYAALHLLDEKGFTRLVVERLPPGDEWNAVRDRLNRAAFREEGDANIGR